MYLESYNNGSAVRFSAVVPKPKPKDFKDVRQRTVDADGISKELHGRPLLFSPTDNIADLELERFAQHFVDWLQGAFLPVG